jgi:hypothetical protein
LQNEAIVLALCDDSTLGNEGFCSNYVLKLELVKISALKMRLEGRGSKRPPIQTPSNRVGEENPQWRTEQSLPQQVFVCYVLACSDAFL